MLELVYKNTILKSIHNSLSPLEIKIKLELVYKNTILKSIHNLIVDCPHRLTVGISL